MSRLREAGGGLLLCASFAAIVRSVMHLQSHDFVSALIMCVIGLALLGAGFEALRPSIGE